MKVKNFWKVMPAVVFAGALMLQGCGKSSEEPVQEPKKDPVKILEATQLMALSDSILSNGDVANILDLAASLNINRDSAILMLCDRVKTEPNLQVVYVAEEAPAAPSTENAK